VKIRELAASAIPGAAYEAAREAAGPVPGLGCER
jgi:hypothetical protein